MFFQSIAFQKTIILFRNEIWPGQKHKLFTTLITITHWVKPAQPSEPILLASTLLMGGGGGLCRATPEEPAY